MSATEAEAGPSTAQVKDIRITGHGKIQNWVAFALEHFKNLEAVPLVLHTLPASVPAFADAKGSTQAQEKQRHTKPENLHPSMAAIPKLITVVEIIKREYLKTLDPKLAQQGSLSGLHQYNEVGSLEEEGILGGGSDNEEDRPERLVEALSGRNHVKQKRTAFMRVTLCRKEAPDLVRRGVTYQIPAVRQLTRSTKMRLKKKQRKEKEKAAAGASA